MKSNFKYLALAAAGAVLWAGCEPKTVPIGAYPAPVSTADRTTVANFNDGTANINPFLFESGVPGNTVTLLGAVTVVNNFTSPPKADEFGVLSIEGPGANNSPLACHVSGAVTDYGDGVYPAIDLQAQMEGGKRYNMSFFTGVNFYFKTGTDDSAKKRVFQIPLYETQAVPTGNCDNSTNRCYDHFGTALSATNGSWQKLSLKFSSLTRQGFGFPLTPTDLSGFNLTQVLWLLWEEGNSNAAGTATVDFWVDEIQFF